MLQGEQGRGKFYRSLEPYLAHSALSYHWCFLNCFLFQVSVFVELRPTALPEDQYFVRMRDEQVMVNLASFPCWAGLGITEDIVLGLAKDLIKSFF